MQKKKETQTEELYNKFGLDFDFTLGDLEANLAGFMSHRQKQSRWKGLRFAAKFFLFAVIVYIVFVNVLQFMSVMSDSDAMGLHMSMIIFVVIIASIVAYPLFSHIQELKRGRVQSLLSAVRIEMRHVGKQGLKPFLVAGEHVFILPNDIDATLWKPELMYRIFFLPKNKTILSIEEVLPQ